jgi:exodeoxyribonuclease-3
MALHRKMDALLALKPDIAVISEVANPQILGEKTDLDMLSGDPAWLGSNKHKGLGVFAFGDWTIRLAAEFDPALRYVLPLHINGPQAFNLLAVWAMNANDGLTRKDQVGPVRTSLDVTYKSFLGKEPAVAAGDFNNNVYWDRPGWPINWADAVELFANNGMVSAYHEHMGEAQGDESIPTHYWRDRTKDGPTYHLDYIFLPQAWLSRMREFTIGSFEAWCGSKLSDHVPLVIDIA